MTRNPMTLRQKSTRGPRWRSALAVLFLAGMTFSSLQACDNARCEELRDELFQLKLSWQECDTSDDCIVVAGNKGDCTGVFSCDFGVNKAYRVRAERRILSLPQESVDCHTCSSPSCVRSNIAVCEARSHLCTVVSGILDGGEPSAIDFLSSGDIPTVTEPADASLSD